jgi:hypothetical protein
MPTLGEIFDEEEARLAALPGPTAEEITRTAAKRAAEHAREVRQGLRDAGTGDWIDPPMEGCEDDHDAALDRIRLLTANMVSLEDPDEEDKAVIQDRDGCLDDVLFDKIETLLCGGGNHSPDADIILHRDDMTAELVNLIAKGHEWPIPIRAAFAVMAALELVKKSADALSRHARHKQPDGSPTYDDDAVARIERASNILAVTANQLRRGCQAIDEIADLNDERGPDAPPEATSSDSIGEKPAGVH